MAEEKKKRDISHVEFADHPPTWVKMSDLTFVKRNNDMQTVLDFFVVHSPCSNVSARGIDLTAYNWSDNNPPKGKYLYNKILSVADLVENQTLFIGEGVDKTKDLFIQAGMDSDFWNKISSNRIALVPNGNLIMTIFKIIRNCFAHCRFTIVPLNDDFLIAMENGVAKANRFEVKSRMILKLSTLIEWIRIIKEDYSEAEKQEQQYAKQVEAALLDVIRNNDYQDTDDMISKVDYSRKDVKAAKKRLITLKIIEYSRKEKRWVILSEVK